LTKTSMCTAWLKGGCPLEARYCPYAHGPDELRCTPLFFKVAMCMDFMAGTCTFGDSCRFAHGAHELKKTTDIDVNQIASSLEEASTRGKQVGAVASSETSTATPGSSVMGDWMDRQSSKAGAQVQGGPDLTKSSMCTAWLKGGCPLEARHCPYAHGPKELRCTPMPFKVAMCKDFMAGTCTFGDSCRFAHGGHELKKTTDIDAHQSASSVEEEPAEGKQVGAVATSETSTTTLGSSVMGDSMDRQSPKAGAQCPKLRYATFSRSTYAPMFSSVNFGSISTQSPKINRILARAMMSS